MPHTGQKPGRGTYSCNDCNEVVTLTDTSDSLPPCPFCQATDYTLVNTLEPVTQSADDDASTDEGYQLDFEDETEDPMLSNYLN